MEEGAARRYGDRAEDGLGAIEQLPRALAVAPALRDESEVSEGPSHIVLRPLALRRVQASLQLLAGLVHGPHLRQRPAEHGPGEAFPPRMPRLLGQLDRLPRGGARGPVPAARPFDPAPMGHEHRRVGAVPDPSAERYGLLDAGQGPVPLRPGHSRERGLEQRPLEPSQVPGLPEQSLQLGHHVFERRQVARVGRDGLHPVESQGQAVLIT